MDRRLTAILSADVVGYSRLMGEDEAGTLVRLEDLKAEVLDPLIDRHNGRIVKLMGDGFLVEFGSVVDAIECALAWQKTVEARALNLAKDMAIRFRVGVNIGDVMVRGEDVYGDAVNIAARLEGLAEPGEVMVSRTVVNHVKGKISSSFEDLGEQQLKNISEPVHVYRVVALSGASGATAAQSKKAGLPKIPVIAAGLAVLLLASGTILWLQVWTPSERSVSVEDIGVPLSEIPSVAVLPFTNISDDPAQEYFADGMTEDLITDLSKISGLFVIARNSTFAYKGQSPDVREVARRLGVRFVVEGSVRKVAERIRINVQLIDAATGHHLWAERYDREATDVFDLQDEVRARIVAALQVELTPAEENRLAQHLTGNPEAYDAYLRGMEYLSSRRGLDEETNLAARAAFEKAVQIDPYYAAGYAGLAWSYWLHYSTINYYAEEMRLRAFEVAEKSLSLTKNALAYRVLAKKHFTISSIIASGKRPDLATSQLEAAEQLEPSNSDVLADLAEVLPFAGRPREALAKITKAIELNPEHPDWYLRPYAIALFFAGDYEQSARIFETWLASSRISKEYYVWLAAAWSLAGKPDRAKQILDEQNIFRSVSPSTLMAIDRRWPLAPEEQEIFFRGLRLSGVQDGASTNSN